VVNEETEKRKLGEKYSKEQKGDAQIVTERPNTETGEPLPRKEYGGKGIDGKKSSAFKEPEY